MPTRVASRMAHDITTSISQSGKTSKFYAEVRRRRAPPCCAPRRVSRLAATGGEGDAGSKSRASTRTHRVLEVMTAGSPAIPGNLTVATYSLMIVGREYLLDPRRFRAAHPNPWVVWRPEHEEKVGATSVSGLGALDLNAGEPKAVEVVKSAAGNGFAFGITIGHAENNDIVLRDPSVSRFHAYLQQGPVGWSLVDAGSKNGTRVLTTKLAPSQPFKLSAHATLGLGGVRLDFFEPEAFVAWLEEQMSK